MEEKTSEYEARQNLLECLDENAEIDLYSSGMDKSKLKIDQQQSKTHQEIGQWESDGHNILSSLGEYQNKQRNDNSSQTSKASVDSKTQLSARFLQINRRQNAGQGGNLQTVYSSLTNNSNIIRNSAISSQAAGAEDKISKLNSSMVSNQDLQESSIFKGQVSRNDIQSQQIIDEANQQKEEMQSSWLFMSPNYAEHRKQLQVGMLMDRHKLKNNQIKLGQKTIESVTFNDKQIIVEINQDKMSPQSGNAAGIGSKRDQQQDGKQQYKALQCKEYTLASPATSKDKKKPKQQIKSEENGQDIFRQLNYYDVLDIKGQESLDTLHLKNDIKKYKNLRPGTYIGVVPKKDQQFEKNFQVLRVNQLSSTLDLSNLKLFQNTTTPFQVTRGWRKKQSSVSEERTISGKQDSDHQNMNQKIEQFPQKNSKDSQHIQLNIESITNSNQGIIKERIYSQTSRNSLNLTDGVDFQEKFREQASQNSYNDNYSPLKPKFTLNSNQQKPIHQQRRVSIKGGGGFYYIKDDMLYKIEKEDELIQQLNSSGEINIQTLPIQQFIEHEKKKENYQILKQQQKENEINLIQQEVNSREFNYSPTSVVNKYTHLMRDNPGLKKNFYYVNKKMNRLERKKTIEEFRLRSNSPLAQIIDAVNQNPLIKQSTTFYQGGGGTTTQKNPQQLTRVSQSPKTLKGNKLKGLPEKIPVIEPQQMQQNFQQQTLGVTNYTKYRKWKGNPLFNLENNDLNRNPYINSGFSPLIAQQSPLSSNIKGRSTSQRKKPNSINLALNAQIQSLYNPIPQGLLEQPKKFKSFNKTTTVSPQLQLDQL